MKVLKTLLITLIIFGGSKAFSQSKEELIGFWKSCDDDNFMVVEIRLNSQNKLIGELVGYHHPDGTWTERKSKDRTLVMYNFEYQGELKWKKGKIYDPLADRTYRGSIELLNSNLLTATGHWGFFWDDINFKRFSI